MASERDRETFGAKLWLLVIDKLLLGLIVLLLGHWLDVRLAELNHSLDLSLQTRGKVIEYQKTLFDRRADAYLDVLQKAHRATDSRALFWESPETPGWLSKLSTLESQWDRLSGRGSGGSSFFRS